MKLTNQAMGAIMMALQKSLLEQSDIVPMLQEMDFEQDTDQELNLVVLNPPVVSLDGVTPAFTIEQTEESEDTSNA
jgi:hypothetical protein